MVTIEIWRLEYAIAILNVIKNVFGVEQMNIPPNLVAEDMEKTVPEFTKWEVPRKDSTLVEMIDCSDLIHFIFLPQWIVKSLILIPLTSHTQTHNFK